MLPFVVVVAAVELVAVELVLAAAAAVAAIHCCYCYKWYYCSRPSLSTAQRKLQL